MVIFFRYHFIKGLLSILSFFLLTYQTFAQTTETLSSGAFIINMGVTPPTVNNSLKPYGLVYAMLKNFSGPVKWVINPTKPKDGTDFTYNGVQYKAGTFIIPAESRTAVVNSLIASWQSQGVVGGSAPFTYSWTTTGGSGLTPTNQNQTGLTDGSYTVLVTDTKDCTATATYALNYANPAPTKPGAITKNQNKV